MLFCLVVSNRSFAQDGATSTPLVQLTGAITLTADFYNSTSTPDSAQPSRRPPSLYRLLFSPTLKFGDLISIPFNIILTAPETNTTTPSVSSPTIAQFIENPANALGFSSITPKIGWAEFSLGSFSPNYSTLSVGNQQLFGGGFDLKPGNFRIAASYGISQRAIEPDTINNIQGAYQRNIYMARVAFGKEDETIIGLNVVSVSDVQNSLKSTIVSITPAHKLPTDTSVLVPTDTIRLKAQQGFVASSDFKMKISDAISFNVEGALSSFTADQSSPTEQIAGNPLNFAQTTRTSTRADFAGNAAIDIQEKIWGIKFSGLYMGAGFVPIGYVYMQSDKLELSVAPSIRLFDNKFSLNGTIGQRTNNLSGTLGQTTTQLIGSASLNADISNAFNLSAQYSNFGIRNNQSSDTLKVQNVSQSLSVNPTVTIRDSAITQIFAPSFAIDEFKDFNVVSGAQTSNNTRTLLGSYTALLSSIPLTLNLFASYMENRLSTGTLIIRSIGTSVGYSFFERNLTTTFSVTSSGSTLGSAPTDQQVFYKFGIRWHALKKLDVSANIGNNNYLYGNPIQKGSSFKETLIRLSIATQF